MESFVLNGASLVIYSFCSYFVLVLWVRYKKIENWVPYMNQLTIGWILTSYLFLLPDLISNTGNLQLGVPTLIMLTLIFSVFTTLSVKNTVKLYGKAALGFSVIQLAMVTLFICARYFEFLSGVERLFGALMTLMAILGITIKTYYKNYKRMSIASICYVVSGIILLVCCAVFWDKWDMLFMLFVMIGALLMQVVGFSLYFLESIYNEREDIKLSESKQIKKNEAVQSRAYFLEHYDSVTRLRNQTNLSTKFPRWQQRSDQQWLLMLNISNFKQYNNIYGYQAGNHLLKQLAEWLIRKMEDERHVFRFENDVYLLRYTGAREAVEKRANRLVNEFRHTFIKPSETANLELQIFITAIKKEGSLESHIHELSLARSSNDQSSAVYFYGDRAVDNFVKNLDIQMAVREAIKEERFVVYYQPKVNIQTGEIVGAEALVRMVTQEGIVEPGKFIPVAERSGLIKDIGYIVMNQTFRDMKSISYSVPVSINLSAVQLFDDELIERLKRLVDVYRVPTQQFSLEITETAVMKNFKEGVKQLERIRALGFRVSLDDFGTGYSSFAYLMHMPIQELKVDRSLVKEIVYEPKQQIIMKTLTNLGRDLCVELIIEGIETAEQCQVIMGLGGSIGQGYLFDPPLTLEIFKEKLLKNYLPPNVFTVS